MLVSEFVDKYNSLKQKESFINKHIKTTYIPYSQKTNIAHQIVELAMYKTINGKKVFIPNSPVRYFLFIEAIIENYTDLEWDKLNVENNQYDINRDFDLLEQYSITDAIFNTIGEDAVKLTNVLNMVMNDEEDKNRSIVSFLETKYETLSILIDSIQKSSEDSGIREKLISMISELPTT